MKKPKETEEQVKTTIRLPREVWHAARVRALEQRIDFQDWVAEAMRQHLKRKEGGR